MEIESKFWNYDYYVNFKLKIGKYENVIDFLKKHDLFFLASLDINFNNIPLNLRGNGNSKNLLDYLSKNTNNTPLIKIFIEYFITNIIKIEPIKYFLASSNKWETMKFVVQLITISPFINNVTSGTSGTSGSSGSSGSSGTSGTNGLSGTSGTSGINGAAGTSGTSGTSGVDLEPRIQTVEGEIDTLQITVAGIETLLAAI